MHPSFRSEPTFTNMERTDLVNIKPDWPNPKDQARPESKTPPITRLTLLGGSHTEPIYMARPSKRRTTLTLSPVAWMLIGVIAFVVAVETVVWIVR